MKNLYLVDYWVPFPSSEYGGMVAVVAEDDHDCHDVLMNWRDELDSQYDTQIITQVKRAPKFSLLDEEESRVVEAFTT
tara:strand:- start:123 stop:356 length:234 start_codon:yes stop_codon:yes gene_type:complete